MLMFWVWVDYLNRLLMLGEVYLVVLVSDMLGNYVVWVMFMWVCVVSSEVWVVVMLGWCVSIVFGMLVGIIGRVWVFWVEVSVKFEVGLFMSMVSVCFSLVWLWLSVNILVLVVVSLVWMWIMLSLVMLLVLKWCCVRCRVLVYVVVVFCIRVCLVLIVCSVR